MDVSRVTTAAAAETGLSDRTGEIRRPVFVRVQRHPAARNPSRSRSTDPHAVSEAPGNTQRAFSDRDRTGRRSATGRLGSHRSQDHSDPSPSSRVVPEPEKPALYGARASFESSLSKIEPAIADFTEAIRLRGTTFSSGDAWFFAGRANLYLARGETDRALADYDEAIRLDPKSPWVHSFRGLAHTRKRRWDRAIADHAKAKDLAGSDKHLTFNCISSHADILAMTDRIPEAEAGYEESVKFDPARLPHSLVVRAWFIDRLRGDYDAALQKLDEAAKSGMIWQFLDRGLILVHLGMPDRALADFSEVLERVKPRPDWLALANYYPRWLALVLGRAEAYLLKGDLDRALVDADEAVRFAPRTAEARLLRARVHDKRGNPDIAAADQNAAAGLAPDPMLALPEPRSAGAHDRR